MGEKAPLPTKAASIFPIQDRINSHNPMAPGPGPPTPGPFCVRFGDRARGPDATLQSAASRVDLIGWR